MTKKKILKSRKKRKCNKTEREGLQKKIQLYKNKNKFKHRNNTCSTTQDIFHTSS